MANERDETTDMAPPEEIQEIIGEETPPPAAEVPESVVQPTWEESFAVEEVTPIPRTGLNLGSLRDRIAAGLLDLFVLSYLYIGVALIYNYVGWRDFLRPIPTHGTHGLVFHIIFMVLFFSYFLIGEGVFFTTLGKFLARLSVRNHLGEGASLPSIILRNLIRPIDYLLGFFPLWILLEKTKKQQRLGDFLARTVVMKHYSRLPQRVSVTGHTASASLRLISGTFDLVMSGLWIAGISLSIDYQRPILSTFLLLSIPCFYLLWHLFWEGLFQTSFGLWVFGCKLVSEEGIPIYFTQAFLRALFRLFDTNPLGWLTLFLSSKNQKPSDLAAATVVVHTKRTWNTLIAVGVSLGLVGSAWLIGLNNSRSWLTPFFKINFLPKVFRIQTAGVDRKSSDKNFAVKNFKFLGPDRTTVLETKDFKPGETLTFSFDLSGFTVRDNEAWIQEDLIVRYPNHSVGFKKEKIVEFRQFLKNPNLPVEFVNTLSLPPQATPGSYTMVMTFKDRLSDRQLTEQRKFRIIP